MNLSKFALIPVLMLVSLAPNAAEMDLLSLTEAENMALKRDLIIQGQSANALAMQEQAVAADNWADRKSVV